MTGYGQDDCGSLAGRNTAVWNLSVVLVFSHIVHARCRVSCGYLLVSLCETLPTCFIILLVPVLVHWSDQHLYNADRLEECVLPLPFPSLKYHNGSVSYSWFTYWMFSKISFGNKTTFQKSTMYHQLLTLWTVCCSAHYVKPIAAAFIRWS